jgi:hypothetical protein
MNQMADAFKKAIGKAPDNSLDRMSTGHRKLLAEQVTASTPLSRYVNKNVVARGEAKKKLLQGK